MSQWLCGNLISDQKNLLLKRLWIYMNWWQRPLTKQHCFLSLKRGIEGTQKCYLKQEMLFKARPIHFLLLACSLPSWTYLIFGCIWRYILCERYASFWQILTKESIYTIYTVNHERQICKSYKFTSSWEIFYYTNTLALSLSKISTHQTSALS